MYVSDFLFLRALHDSFVHLGRINPYHKPISIFLGEDSKSNRPKCHSCSCHSGVDFLPRFAYLETLQSYSELNMSCVDQCTHQDHDTKKHRGLPTMNGISTKIFSNQVSCIGIKSNSEKEKYKSLIEIQQSVVKSYQNRDNFLSKNG